MRRASIATAFLLLVSPVMFVANTVSWDAGNPTAAKGQVSGKGTFTIDPGWTAIGSSLIVVPTAGGMGYNTSGTVTAPPANTWGCSPITGIPAAQYNVTATVTFKKGTTTVVYSARVGLAHGGPLLSPKR